MATDFVELTTDNDPDILEQDAYALIQSQFPDWEPNEGDLDTWIVKVASRIGSSVYDVAANVAAEIFKQYGITVVNIPPIQAASATVESTWTMIDSLGHTIPDGTLVNIYDGDTPIAFRTVGDVVVGPGDTTTGAGEVILSGDQPGADGNDLTTDPVLVDSLAFVDSIAIVGTTSGGVDAEDPDAYLDRLAEELQLFSFALILPRDFEIDARNVAGVVRATAIDGYNPGDKSSGNPWMVALAVVDVDGAALSSDVKDAVEARQQAKLTANFVVNVIDPDYTTIDAVVEVALSPGFDSADMIASVEAALADYFAPANWGVPDSGDTFSGAGWTNTDTVYYNDIVSQVDRVIGVSRVVNLSIGGGSGKAYTVAASTDTFASTAHGFNNGDAVIVRDGLTDGAPLEAGVIYYVRDKATDTFKLTATVGGSAIDITSDGSGTVVAVGTADVSLAGVAPLTEAGTFGVTTL